MKHKKNIAAGLIALLAFLPAMAKADIQTIRSFDSAAWVSFGSFQFNYKETVPGIPDSERGWIPSAAIGGSYMTKENIYVAVDGSIAFGHETYKGAYLYFPTVPLQGTTNETIGNVDGKVGYGFALGSNAMIIPYVDLGFRNWERDLSSVQSESYHNMAALGGVMLQYTPINRLLLSGYIAGGSIFDADMRTGDHDYILGDSAIYKIGGKVGFDITRKIEVFTTLDYDHFRYGRSGLAVDTSYEPTSSTEETTARIGVAYHLQ